MKKIKQFLAILAMSLMALPVFAQEDSVAFNPHLKLNVQGGIGYTVGETSFGDLISPAAALNLGYDFSPILGARFGISGLEGRGYMPNVKEGYKFNYVQASLDLTLDLANLFCGFKYDRVFNPYIFAGIGYNYGFNNDEAVAINNAGATMGNLWEGSQGLIAGRFGVGAEFRVSEVIGINLEVNANTLSDKFNSKDASNCDWQGNALVGITFNLGKTHKTINRPQAKAAPAPAPVQEPEPQPEVVKEVAPAVVAQVAEMTQDIFFKINSAVISEEGTTKINALISFLNENPSAKISLQGYADAQTGNKSINQRISTKRVDAVKDALINGGIAQSRINAEAKGDNPQPFSVNDKNRVVICIAK